MESNGLVISKIMDVTIVDFKISSILDSAAVEGIGTELYKLVDEQALRRIVVDFSGVRFLSSQMLGVLIAAHKKSAAIGGTIIFCGLRPELFKIFKIMKLEKLMTFAENEEQALQKFDVHPQT